MCLKDKVVIITGGGSGIGADGAKAFLAAGARVVLNGRREGQLRRTAESLDPSAARVAIVAGDIGEIETSRRLVETAVQRFGGVDVLFNNAGIFKPTPFLQVTPAELNEYLRLAAGYYFTTQAAVAEMKRRGHGGAVINTGSMWALHAIAATPCSASSTPRAAYAR